MKLPKSRRITRGSEFARVRRKGESIGGRYLVMGYLHDESLKEPFRLGLITTRKIGNAVIRNRVRRRLRAIVQKHGDIVEPGYWLVLIARNGAATATSAQLEKEWRWMLRKTDLLKTEDSKT